MNSAVTQKPMDKVELEKLCRDVLDEAGRRGADQAEVAASHSLGLSATARLGDVENLEYTNDRGIGITVYFGQRKGSASTSDLTAAALREAVAKACTFAEHTAFESTSPDEIVVV